MEGKCSQLIVLPRYQDLCTRGEREVAEDSPRTVAHAVSICGPLMIRKFVVWLSKVGSMVGDTFVRTVSNQSHCLWASEDMIKKDTNFIPCSLWSISVPGSHASPFFIIPCHLFRKYHAGVTPCAAHTHAFSKIIFGLMQVRQQGRPRSLHHHVYHAACSEPR